MTRAKSLAPPLLTRPATATSSQQKPLAHAELSEVAVRLIRGRYTLGLLLVALLTIGAGGFIQFIVSFQTRSANLVNIAGRQRMLSQRSTLFASQLVILSAAQRPATRQALRDALALMERSHLGLMNGDPELRLSGSPSPTLRAMYFAAPLEVDRRVRDFLRSGRELLALPDAALRSDLPQLQLMLVAARGPLLSALDTVVRSYAAESETQVATFQIVEAGIVLLTLSVLMLEAIYIFRPLEREVGKQTRDLIRAHDETIEGWSRALDLRDRETEGHSLRVKTMTVRLASLAGMKESALMHVRRGALLHDIGKVGIPDAILLKPGALDETEWEIMRRHPRYAADLLEPIEFLRPALEIPLYHHERWDGNGYPTGLSGESIPFSARLFAVVDIWDALRSNRPYRAGWDAARVRAHISDLAGSHLDPQAVKLFLDHERLILEGLYSD